MLTTQTYEVIINLAPVRSSTYLTATTLGTLSKGSRIEVISINKLWAYFKYKNKDAYVLSIYLKLVKPTPIVTGSITIKYVDIDSKLDVAFPTEYTNLQLKSYTYTAKEIPSYTVIEPSIKSVILTQDNYNQTITFLYKKNIVYGSVTINYINGDTQESIVISETQSNLALGDYTYTAKVISHYNLVSDQTITVTLTESNPNQTIKFEYIKILGSVIVRYIDNATQVDIVPPAVFNNLELTLYSYNAIAIPGYNISGNSSMSVLLTESLHNRTIIFEYSKILGKVAIQYILIDTRKEITTSDLFINLELGTYNYNAKTIDGYVLVGESNKTVTLSDTFPIQTLIFEYRLDNPTIQNEVPYISTYYIKPVVAPNEEVIIDYYITDYYHKEYVNEDFSELFTVTVKIDGKDDIVIENLNAGDHSVNLGYFSNLDEQEQKFSILCTDKLGRNSHELFNFFLVRNEVLINEYIMSEEDLSTYNISNKDDTTALVSTREGLQKFLDDKQALGFNKLRLLLGTYRIDHLLPIYIPTKFTLDMNGSTIKLHEFAGDKAIMVELNNTFDSHVINGTIEGDFYNHDYTNSLNNSEWVHGISIGGEAKYSTFDNLTIKDITGYGTLNGIKNSRDNKLGYTYLSPRGIGSTFKLGDIDRSTGLDIVSTNRTTCDFRDITGYSDIGYLSVSLYLGYQGNPCGTWNLICHFYDANKNFIKSTDAYQYRRVGVPSNAKFMRVTILNEAYPTNLSIQLFRVPTHCALKNLKLENCRCIGIAPQAMNNMLFESCELTQCGKSSAKCALDAEDGWDMMQDATFRKLNFYNNPNNEFLTAAGHNFIVEDMVNGKLYFWERTNSYIVRNCKNLKSTTLGHSSRIRSGYSRFYKNIVNSSVSIGGDSTNKWLFVVKDCTINGRPENNLGAGVYLRCDIGANANPINTYVTAMGLGNFVNCYIHDKKGENTGGVYTNCKIENITGNIHNTFDMVNCQISNWSCNAGSYTPSYLFKNCNLTNFQITFPYWHQGATTLFQDCKINNTNYLLKLPHYAMKKSITLINNVFSSTTTVGMVNFYDDRTGGSAGDLVPQNTLRLESNSISLPNSLYIVTGLTKTTVNNINIVAIKNIYTPSTLLLCNPDAKLCPNITIIEN